ncbi:trypsin-1 [Procambarus clarkii]|uniref:trypsin-1 n=1 Tax=Procambarus clarkii TaxID=6728 RepID=UPI001E67528F|nr:trypsin-1-like [Procambarus clarkii]
MHTLAFVLQLAAAALAVPSVRVRPRLPDRLGVVGGTDATPGELPYQISLQDLSYGFAYHFCGASIKSELWLLTAAHCVDEIDLDAPDYIQAVAGDVNQVINEGTEQEIALAKIIIHEDYDGFTIVNDIALLQLSSPLELTSYVKPIALPPAEHTSTGMCVVSGFGATTEGGDPSDTLQKVSLPVWSDSDCQFAYEGEIEEGMFCAGLKEGGHDACGGDSGGPLACDDLDTRYLAGIVSWGFGCGRPDFPGVYTKVSHYIDWINSISS